MGGKSERGFADEGELGFEVGRGLVAVGFIVGVHVIAECVGAFVEHTREMGRAVGAFKLFEQLPEHVAKTRHSAHGQSVRFARQRRQRVIGAENIGRGIYQIEVAVFVKRC